MTFNKDVNPQEWEYVDVYENNKPLVKPEVKKAEGTAQEDKKDDETVPF